MDFAIIGSQKSASSSLHWFLRQHASVFSPREETSILEDYFFTRDKFNVFCNQCEVQSDGKIWGIKRPNLIYESSAVERISKLFPSIRLIACFRDPVSRVLSAYYHYMRGGFIPLVAPDAGLQRIFSEEAALTRPEMEIRDYGRYSKYLHEWTSVFPKEQFCFILDEDLRLKHEETLKQVASFLGLSASSEWLSLHAGQNVGVYSFPRLRLLRVVGAVTTRRFGESVHNERRRPRFIMRGIYGGFYRLDKAIISKLWPNVRAPLSESTQSMIRDYYRNEASALGALIDRDLSAWSRPKVY